MSQESFPDRNIRNVSRQIILSGAAGIEAGLILVNIGRAVEVFKENGDSVYEPK
jgi:hypothetical protein